VTTRSELERDQGRLRGEAIVPLLHPTTAVISLLTLFGAIIFGVKRQRAVDAIQEGARHEHEIVNEKLEEGILLLLSEDILSVAGV